MSFAKVTYPPPPPTCNTLTSQDRSHLLRSTKKLGKILGSAPHIIDDPQALGPVHVNLSLHQDRDTSYLEIDDSPTSDHSSTRSASFSSESTISYDSTDTSTSLSSSGSMTSYTGTVNSTEVWRARKPTRKPPPLLRLTSNTVMQGPPSTVASVKPALDTIPASPRHEIVTTNTSAECLRHSSKSNSFTDNNPLVEPSFEIPSEATLRSAKMERLKRRLGDDVPVDLVFPADVTSNSIVTIPQFVSHVGRTGNKALPSLPNPVPRSSFSLERPLFGIVEPDDHVSGCFEFGSRRERAAMVREHGRRRT